MARRGSSAARRTPACQPTLASQPGGFTLVEILITIVIVTVGLFGVLALLTSALKASGDVVENSFATTLARSVYESLREGARNRSFLIRDATSFFGAGAKDSNGFVRGFLFVHDGVRANAGVGAPPAAPIDMGDPAKAAVVTPPVLPSSWDGTDAAGKAATIAGSDFAVFLPLGPTTGTTEKYYIFPRPGPASGTVSQANVANVTLEDNKQGNDNSHNPPVAGYGGTVPFVLKRVYRLAETGLGPVGQLGPVGSQYPRPEGSDQYGFAIVVSRAPAPPLVDSSGSPIGTFPPRLGGGPNFRDGLYRVEVMVFRNFDPDVKGRRHMPVQGGNFVGLVAVGP